MGGTGVFPGPGHHTTGGVHMADAGPGGGAGHGGPAGVSEQVQHRDRPSGPADLLLGEVPVGRLLGKQSGVLEVHGLDVEGEAAIGHCPALRHGFVLPLPAAGGGAGVAACVLLPAAVGAGSVPDGLGIRPDQQLVAPALQLLSPAAVDEFIVFPLVGTPHIGHSSPVIRIKLI